MRLVQHTKLFFKEGKSDKTYEIDLCQVGEGEFLVNFRYGRRGDKLKEGTKTVFPVSEQEAQKIYDKLVLSKTNKGYAAEGQAASISQESNAEGREDKILAYLAQAAKGKALDTTWPLSRIIWRAGELQLDKALDALLEIKPTALMDEYVLLWALARLKKSEASIQKVRHIYGVTPHEQNKKLAHLILFLYGTAEEKESIHAQLMALIPSVMHTLVKEKKWLELKERLEEYLFQLKTKQNDYLESLYLLALTEKELLEQVVAPVLLQIPFIPNYFKHVRFVFKVSEMIEEPVAYAIIAKKFEAERAYYNKASWGNYAYTAGEYFEDVYKELKKKDAKLAYSKSTKLYFQKRVNRWLDRMIDTSRTAYTRTATEVLLTYSEQDNTGTRQHANYAYNQATRRYDYITLHLPAYHQYYLFNRILYSHSEYIVYNQTHSFWQYKDQNAIGQNSETRTEAAPHLWDQDGDSLVRLMMYSHCEPVQRFAIKAFKENPQKESLQNISLILSLLAKPFDVSVAYGMTLATEIYDSQNPQKELLIALIHSSLKQAQTLGLQWFADHQQDLLKDFSFGCALLFSPSEHVQLQLRNSLSTYDWGADQKEKLALQLLEGLSLESTTALADEALKRILDTINYLFGTTLQQVEVTPLLTLVKAQRVALQLFACQVLATHQSSVDDLPEDLFTSLIISETSDLRQMGVKLFAKLSPSILESKKEIIANFCISSYTEVRTEAIPIVEKLAQRDRAFAESLMLFFLPVFYQKEKHEGLHHDLLLLFKQAFSTVFSVINSKQLWKLISANSISANELGYEVLCLQDSSTLDIKQIISLASHELLALRQFSWSFYRNNVARIKYELSQAVKITDASWQDSRDFAFAFFTEQIKEEWTAEILISLCDSNLLEVQQYGKKMITTHFQKEDGIEYMLKLSQHPNTEIQLFVSNYLDTYASNQFERIKALDYYFTSVLSQVNKGRVSKERVYHFIRKESAQSEEIACWFIALLNRISLTIAIKDKAHCIQLLLELKMKYSHLETVVEINEIPTR